VSTVELEVLLVRDDLRGAEISSIASAKEIRSVLLLGWPLERVTSTA
jgi:hypothetical protein